MSLSAAPLPLPLTPLVGRERELALATTMLNRDDVRLLTITGPGGIGKTRLAIEIGHAQAANFTHGVVFVPLELITDCDRIIPAFAWALGLKGRVESDWHENLVIHLRHANLLFVVDNVEHMLPATPLFTSLLGSCPHIKILATSRSLLRLSGEYALPAPPLEFPPPEADHRLDIVKQSPAVRLFVERAQAVRPGFTLDAENGRLISAMCRHLDGLPLAIELAAAHVAVLAPGSLLARIQAHLPLPLDGPRDSPVRLRSIAEAVAWSYNLLSAEEQRIFRCVSVFVGGFTLDDAEVVVGSDVLTGIATLVEKSLLRQHEWDGETRFTMLLTIRGYAWGQAVARDEADALGEAHANWTLNLTEPNKLAAAILGQEQTHRRLEANYANLLAALHWLDEHNQTNKLLWLCGSVGAFWFAAGHYREGRFWLEHSLERAPTASDAIRSRARISLARLIADFGEVEQADQILADVIAILSTEDDLSMLTVALTRRAIVANQRADHQRASHHLHEALALTAGIDDPILNAMIVGSVHANLGVAEHGLGNLDRASTHHEEALHIFRKHGSTLGIARSLRDLGEIRRDQEDMAGALDLFVQSLDSLEEEYELHVIVDALEGSALIAANWNDPRRAALMLGCAESFREQWGGTFQVPVDLLAHDRTLASLRTVLDEKAIAEAWQAGRDLSIEDAVDHIRTLKPPIELAGNLPAATVRLTPREVEVLHQLIAGQPDRVIAESLFLSVRTVEAHVSHILAKLGVRTRTAAVRAAIATGFESHPTSPQVPPDKATSPSSANV